MLYSYPIFHDIRNAFLSNTIYLDCLDFVKVNNNIIFKNYGYWVITGIDSWHVNFTDLPTSRIFLEGQCLKRGAVGRYARPAKLENFLEGYSAQP